MTYLEAINKVLRRLREDEVTSPDATAYSKLIGEFVNDAVRLVEDAWDWGELRVTRPVAATAGTSSYSISGVNENFKVLGVYNATSKTYIEQGTEKDYQDNVYLDGSPQSRPEYYIFRGFSNTDNTIASVFLYPTPDASYTVVFNIVDRSAELTSANTDIRVAPFAVVQLAHAMASEERGEAGSTQSARLYQIAQSTLSDAIAQDAARFPTETVWRDV